LSHGAVKAGSYVRLTVADTGHGMDRDTLGRIFDPFFTTKEVGTGTGLGLSVVHGIVSELGGGIDVESRPGAGSKFEIYLPRAAAAAAAEAETSQELPHGNGETLMFVDDEEALVLLNEEVLAGLGYEPVGFTSSTQALSEFRADPARFDLVLTDETMPGMTGTEFASELRSLRPDIPIILMSGYATLAVARKARAAGVREVLGKPLQAAKLAAAIARALRARAGSPPA
jgi:CheY-like chemotaxis protein